MNFRSAYFPLVAAFLCIGCGSSSRETSSEFLSPEGDAISSSRYTIEELPPLKLMKRWSPQFIQTGLSSGIMIEFTGLKKEAVLNAKYSSVELRRIPDSSSGQLPSSSSDQTLITTLNTTINNLRQAFYKVPPGKYIVRHTKDWAEKSFIQDVEVHEGSFSVVRISVNGQPLSEN